MPDTRAQGMVRIVSLKGHRCANFCSQINFQLPSSELYCGVVVHSNSNKGVFDVRYDDGDRDNSLCRRCVRPRLPFEIDEPVGVRKGGVYYTGRIVAIHDGGTYDVEAKGIEIQRNVTTANLYRVDDSLVLGAVIEAKFQGVGNAWYRGKIVRVNDDGSFDVEYDDGDKEYSVEPENIRFSL